MFVLDTEDRPNTPSDDLSYSSAKCCLPRVLQLKRDDGIKYPVETQYRVHEHGGVVPPNVLVSEFFPEEWALCVWIAKTPVVVDVPETRVDGVNDSKGDKHGAMRGCLVDSVDAQCCIEDDGSKVFAAVEKMRELVACIPITSNALQGAPYSW